MGVGEEGAEFSFSMLAEGSYVTYPSMKQSLYIGMWGCKLCLTPEMDGSSQEGPGALGLLQVWMP